MADAMRSLLDRARRETSRRSLLAGVAAGCAIAAGLLPIFSTFAGFQRSCIALVAVPVAAAVAVRRCRPTDPAIARTLDERFATGELFATAIGVVDTDDGIGRSIVAQADALARRLAEVDLSRGRPTRALATAGVALVLSIAITAGVAPTARSRDVARSRSPIASSDDGDRIVADRSTTAPPQPTRSGEAESIDASRTTAADDAAARRAHGSPANGVGAATSALATSPPMPVPRSTEARSTRDGTPTTGDGAPAGGATDGTAADGTASRRSIDVGSAAMTSPTIARDAIDVARVPAASRALVRAFFDPSDAPR